MFEKHKTSKPETTGLQAPAQKPDAGSQAASPGGKAAIIGAGIRINGDISGDDNLLIEGQVEGKIRLDAHQVEIGPDGKVKADITARVIRIAGEVRGDVTGIEKVIILCTGNVHGNIVAPRMTLEDGALFKGSIDMNPAEPARPAATKPAAKGVEKAPEKKAEAPKPATDKKPGGPGGYTLHGN
ncbi:MAG: polymer-forming cytoskeletal protein [Lysobacterales bacterium]|jgi:cytoskeletal protein CcmA (bactofilin family)